MDIIKNIVCSVVALLAATGVSFAQSYTITPNDTFKITGMMEDLETLSISQINFSNDTINIKWKKISEVVPSNWEAAVCDNRICNTDLADSGMMNPLLPAESGFLLLHITAHVNYGTSVVRYAVWDIRNPLSKDTLTFIMTVNNTSAIRRVESNIILNVFPNPAMDNITIISDMQNDFKYSLTDFSGKEIQSGCSKGNSIFLWIENLSNGFYNISILDKDNNRHTKKIIIQK